MFKSRAMRKARALVLLVLLVAVLGFVGYWVEAIHPVHNFLSFYADVHGFVTRSIDSAHNGS